MINHWEIWKRFQRLAKAMKPKRLVVKALLFMILLIIGPFLVLFWYSSYQATQAIQRQAGGAFNELIRQNHVTIDRVFDFIDQTTATILRSELVQGWSVKEDIALKERLLRYTATEKLLQQHSSFHLQYSLFLFVDHPEDYDFAPFTDISEAGVFFLQRPAPESWLEQVWLEQGLGSVRIIETFGFSPNPGQTVAYARGVMDMKSAGGIFGVVVATGIESLLYGEINTIRLPEKADIHLTNADSVVLAGTAATAGSPYAIVEGGRYTYANVWTSENKMTIYHTSPSYDTRLVYEIPMQSLVGDYTNFHDILQITAIGYFVLILASIVYFGQAVLRPLAKLVGLTRFYEPGKPLAESDFMKREDEIGYAYKAFYRMTNRLNELVTETYVAELKQKEAELMLMHTQITPHLLYNTLDSIYWYGIRGGVPEVAEMVRDLSAMMRIGLSRGKTIITVSEELSHVEAYIKLQEKRYSSLFQSTIRVEQGLQHCMVPKVILQPIVENAIIHGVVKMDGEGEISIAIGKSESDLIIAVEDNGYRTVDLELIQSLLDGTANADRGFGIRNVHKRIQLHYGETFGLSYGIREEGGTRVTIRLPLVEQAFPDSRK